MIAESEKQGERRKEQRAWSGEQGVKNSKMNIEHRTSNDEWKQERSNEEQRERSEEHGAESKE